MARVVNRLRGGLPLGITTRYDIVFVCCQSVSDLLTLQPIERWTELGAHSVCWIDELWRSSIPRRPREMRLLSQFSEVVIGCEGSVEAVHATTGRPVHYVPPGIDAIGFCPWPTPPERSIDVYCMGRRSPRTHHSLLEFAQQTGRFYLYDSMTGYGVKSYREHRMLLANLIQRSKYFLASRAKANATDQTDTQEEVGFRFFEGTAGGAVILGEAPGPGAFDRLFDRDTAVVPAKFETENLPDLIADLERDPHRLAHMRQSNVLTALNRHDWVFRWMEVLRFVGLPIHPRASLRHAQLAQLAETVQAATSLAA